jgi:hypothetical protein
MELPALAEETTTETGPVWPVPPEGMVRQANIVSRSGTGPTLVTEKAYRFLIAIAHDMLRQDPGRGIFVFDAVLLSRFLGMEPSKFVEDVKKLMAFQVDFDILTQKTDRHRIGGGCVMLSRIAHVREKGTIEFEFPSTIREEILRPTLFRYVSLDAIRAMDSHYSLKIYEFCCACLNPKRDTCTTEWIPEDKFRILLQCKDSHVDLSNFKKYVLAKPLEELNRKTDLQISYEMQGRGERRYFRFVVTRIPQEEIIFHRLDERERAGFACWAREHHGDLVGGLDFEGIRHSKWGLSLLNMWNTWRREPVPASSFQEMFGEILSLPPEAVIYQKPKMVTCLGMGAAGGPKPLRWKRPTRPALARTPGKRGPP